ncbi:MAG: DUF2752 domain-containing protein [Lentisphaeria bacterium]|nr:DUF2752 domain-containing protein [Lentisphaeria bacterium]
MYDTTGIFCAGCGATRSVHAIAHGNFAQAAAYNLLTILVFIPATLLWIVDLSAVLIKGESIVPWKKLPMWIVWVFLSLLMLYSILRNMDAFSFLAPHQL